MIRSGLRKVASKVKRRIKNRLHPEPPVRGGTVSAPVQTSSATPAAPRPAASAVTSPFAAGANQEPAIDGPEAAASPSGGDAGDDLAPLTREVVWDLFEDMVRPALQADGGDIDLIKVEDNDVYVRLTGACRSCPSSTITMRQGIERLLREEFPQFGDLVQVDVGPDDEAAMAAANP